MNELWKIGIILCAIGLHVLGVLGQVDPVLLQKRGQGTTGRNNNFQTLNQPFAIDSTSTDSTVGEEIIIDPEWYYISRQNLFEHQPHLMKRYYDLGTELIWDELEYGEGFLQTLGQIGKPYALYRDGVDERHLDRPFWRNSFMGRYNRYMFDGEYMPLYLDTRTPIVNVKFAQASRKTNRVDVMISRNVNPHLNLLFYYNRREGNGAYANSFTDHNSLYFSSYYRHPKRRYHGFINGVYNEHRDGLNGGIFFGPDTLLRRDGLVYQQNDSLLNIVTSGPKEQIQTMSDDASVFKIVRSIYTDHYYHLIGHPDSSSITNLTLRSAAFFENTRYRFKAPSLNNSDSTRFSLQPVPVLPTWDRDSSFLSETYQADRFFVSGEASFTVDGPFRLHADGGLTIHREEYRKEGGKINQNILEQRLHGELSIPRAKAQINFKQRISSLYDAETRLSVRGDFYPWPKRPAFVFVDSLLTDSLSKVPVTRRFGYKKKKKKQDPPEDQAPLGLHFAYDQFSLNPSIFQSNYIPGQGNLFAPNRQLQNQNLSRLVGEIQFKLPARIVRLDTLLPSYVKARIFFSRMGRAIYYTPGFEVLQAEDGKGYSWLGLELSGRMRLFWNIYMEGNVAVQRGSVSAGVDEALQRYSENIPSLYGTVKLFFDHQTLSIADNMRVGLDVHYNTKYNGFTVDIPTGEFFPTNYQLDAYAWADAYLALKLKGVYVYAKYTHINDSFFPAPAYFTTPLYPILERTFSLGLNWSLFD